MDNDLDFYRSNNLQMLLIQDVFAIYIHDLDMGLWILAFPQ